MWTIYFPLGFYYFTLSVRARSFFFYRAANPCMETGGMYYESKWEIFKKMPNEYYPKTIYIDTNDSFETVQIKMEKATIAFPAIAKPDRGERGFGLKKIDNLEALKTYRTSVRAPFLVQAYIDYPVEVSVFYIKHPNAVSGSITSLTYKKLLTLTGDGYSTIKQLIINNDRAFLQYEKIVRRREIDIEQIPSKGEICLISPYGNHSLGATFIDYMYEIEEDLTKVFDNISKSIEGFNYGRFDIRCESIASLKKGEKFSIIELNGANAEPAHMYDPKHSFVYAQRILWWHYKKMFEIATYYHKQGVPYFSFFDFINGRITDIKYKKSYMVKRD